MTFLKTHKNKIIVAILVAAALAFAFWQGGNAPEPDGAEPAVKPAAVQATPSPSPSLTPETANPSASPSPSAAPLKESEPEFVPNTEPVQQVEVAPVEPENTTVPDNTLTCTLSVRCDTILDNLSALDPSKRPFVPDNGVIFAKQTVEFYRGESVFNLLLREMKRNKIHFEYENTPIYNSAYIEGIGNIYEFDCGELSGWLYKVNGQFPDCGFSRCFLKSGDNVEVVYTCNLGADVGDEYSAMNGM